MSTAHPSAALKRADPDSELAAVRMAAEGKTLAQIAAKFWPPLSIEQAGVAVARGRHLAAIRARETVTAVVNDTAPKPIPLCVMTAITDELLEWAERDGPGRAKTLAARIRRELTDLRGAMARTEIIAWAQSEGYTISMNGAVPRDLMALFNAAHTHGGEA
jgi:hypothetical protein